MYSDEYLHYTLVFKYHKGLKKVEMTLLTTDNLRQGSLRNLPRDGRHRKVLRTLCVRIRKIKPELGKKTGCFAKQACKALFAKQSLIKNNHVVQQALYSPHLAPCESSLSSKIKNVLRRPILRQ